MKRTAIFFAALTLCVAASAQSWSSEWVPRHEFHIDAFGGLSALNYQVADRFAPNASVDFLSKNTLGGGAGLGYTVHFNEHWGLTTGAELAIYRGAFSAANNPWTFFYLEKSNPDDPGVGVLTFGNVKEKETGEKILSEDKMTLSENQTLYAVQVPLMLQFMAPLNQSKSNHFYIAFGARLLFNIKGNYARSFDGFYGDKYKTTDPTGAPVYTDGKSGVILSNPIPGGPSATAGVPAAPYTISNMSSGPDAIQLYDNTQTPLSAADAQAALNDPSSFIFSNQTGSRPSTYQDVFGENVGEDGVIPSLNQKGSFEPKLFNVAASGELGFRWGLGNGWGLYTGLYVDYGFLSPMDPQTKFLNVKTDEQGTPHYAFAQGSMLGMTYDDVTFKTTPYDGDVSAYYINASASTAPIASKLSNIGAGLKLKLAFGSVAKKPQEPQIVYVDRIIRDTVTNTVTVRDTVVKTNTVIEKEIIRDTITIIKEIPVEIQKTMADLSNTMFDFNKSVIKEAAKGPLNSVVKWLQENPEVKVEISGHTDSVGSAAYNQKLSEARAKAVYDYFVSQGVDKFRLAYAGYGKEKPIATNETEEGRAQNRRVELNIIQ